MVPGHTKKILIIVRSLELGGAERVAVNSALFRSRDRYGVAVCCVCGGGPFEADLKAAGIRYFILNKRPGIDLAVLPKLIRIIRAESPDIVHTHNFTANTWGRIAARLCRVPVIVATEHSLTTRKGFPYRFVRKILARATGRIIGVSDAVVRWHSRVDGIPMERYVTIHNGIDPSPFVPSGGEPPAAADSRTRRPTVGIIANLTPPKGHRHFLRAAREISAALPGVMFMLVGDGPLRSELEEQAEELGLKDSVVFTGFRTDIPDLLQTMDVFVLTSVREGFPMAVLEAMAAAKPVVATRVGGMEEVVLDGRTGFLVSPGDEKALALKIITLLKDKDLRENMGREGRERLCKEFTVESMVGRAEALYESLYAR